MTRDPNRQTEPGERNRGLRQYVLGDGRDCPHPRDRRTFLGNQRESAYYRCQGCGAVIIVTPAASVPVGAARHG